MRIFSIGRILKYNLISWGKQISILILKEPASVVYQSGVSELWSEWGLPIQLWNSPVCYHASDLCFAPALSPSLPLSSQLNTVLLGSLTMMLQSKRWWFIDNEIMLSFWGRIMQSQICRFGKDFQDAVGAWNTFSSLDIYQEENSTSLFKVWIKLASETASGHEA